MNIKWFAIIPVLSFVLALSVLERPQSAMAVEFAADIIIQPKGEEALKGKIFVKGEKVRQEEVTEDGENQIMIIRPDMKLTWMLTPEEKVYMEMPYQSEDRTFEEWTPDKEKQSKLLGEESVSGIPCKKFESLESGEKTIFWVSKQYPFPIKVEDSEVVMEYRNIKEDPLADSLFELPEGYKKMSMPVIPDKE